MLDCLGVEQGDYVAVEEEDSRLIVAQTDLPDLEADGGEA